MQFHDYTTFRKLLGRVGDEEMRRYAKSASTTEFLTMVMDGHLEGDDFQNNSWALGEAIWHSLERPYYNVWPIAVEIAPTVRLDLTFSQIELPFYSILLRFARGYEPHQLKTALVWWPNGYRTIQVFCQFGDQAKESLDELMVVQHAYEQGDKVEDWLKTLTARGSEMQQHHHQAGLLMVRLVVFIGLLAQGNDFVTPIVLSKDRAKYESTDDASVREWLENRAAKRAGRGFDVCKRLQDEKNKSPHWRNPHLCLFWTGAGRTKPEIKLRSGAVIQKVSMAEVPTGYLGPETEAEAVIEDEKQPRESLSKSRRFAILKRDGYKCQLCGRSQKDGVSLHVDHRIPRAKGGTNHDDNLWTLCDDCNLGKSDKML